MLINLKLQLVQPPHNNTPYRNLYTSQPPSVRYCYCKSPAHMVSGPQFGVGSSTLADTRRSYRPLDGVLLIWLLLEGGFELPELIS